jgi:Ca-activated chloride channel homolog
VIFANPKILFFLALLPLLVLVFILAERGRKHHLGMMIGESVPGLVMGAGFERRLLYLVFLCLGVGMLVVAAARPQWGSKLEELHARGFDILIAVDVSESMRATDVAPDRISKARQEVDKFLGELSGDRVGLIAFAGSAYAFCPLTSDYGAIRLFLSSLEPGVIDDAGTNLGAAIETALETFERSNSKARKVLVIFSDGENHEEDPLPLAERAAEKGIQIFTVGIGNVRTSGERIPLEELGGQPTYKLDQAGNLVITKLDEKTLADLASKAQGAYYRVSEAGTELREIYRTISKAEESEFSSRIHQMREDRYQYPLALGFVLLTAAYSLGNRSFKRLRRTQGVRQ